MTQFEILQDEIDMMNWRTLAQLLKIQNVHHENT